MPTPPVNAQESVVTREQRTNLLIEALKGYQAGFNTSAYSTMGFLLLAAGWLVTSDEARSFLTDHLGVVNAGIAAIVFGSLAFVFVSYRVYRLSDRIANGLELMPGTQGLYEHYRIAAASMCAYLLALGAVVVLILSLLLAIHAGAQSETAKRFIGTWRLVSTTAAGKEDPNRGPRPTGLIIYDAKGNMAVQIQPDRPRQKYAGAQPTPDEAKTALAGYTAYFGTYSFDEKAGTVTHHRSGNINPGGMGDFVRRYEFVGANRLVLRPVENQNALTWERISP